MPKMTMNPSEEGEMDSLYGEDMHKPDETEGTVDQERQEEAEDHPGGPTDIIKTEVLKGSPEDKVEAGDERVLKVVEVYGDTCKVQYAPKEEKHDPSMHEKSSDEEIDEMD